MKAGSDIAGAQRALWNGVKGQGWAAAREAVDAMFAPMRDALVADAQATRPRRVLDVGCGTGGVTMALARALAPGGDCVGVDVSAPMLAVAGAEAERCGLPARFVEADAGRHAFDPAAFDRIVSRFGVMFFDDPAAAFANLRRAAAPGAALHALVWRDAAENAFMTTAERAAAPHLPALPPRRPDGPGQFAFADPARVRRILAEGGWTEVDIRPADFACSLPAARLDEVITRLGPLGEVLSDSDPDRRAPLLETVRAAFAPYVSGRTVRFTAACWTIAAKAPAASAA